MLYGSHTSRQTGRTTEQRHNMRPGPASQPASQALSEKSEREKNQERKFFAALILANGPLLFQSLRQTANSASFSHTAQIVLCEITRGVAESVAMSLQPSSSLRGSFLCASGRDPYRSCCVCAGFYFSIFIDVRSSCVVYRVSCRGAFQFCSNQRIVCA